MSSLLQVVLPTPTHSRVNHPLPTEPGQCQSLKSTPSAHRNAFSPTWHAGISCHCPAGGIGLYCGNRQTKAESVIQLLTTFFSLLLCKAEIWEQNSVELVSPRPYGVYPEPLQIDIQDFMSFSCWGTHIASVSTRI